MFDRYSYGDGQTKSYCQWCYMDIASYLCLQPKVNFHELCLSRKKCANSLMHTRSVLKAQFKHLVLDCII